MSDPHPSYYPKARERQLRKRREHLARLAAAQRPNREQRRAHLQGRWVFVGSWDRAKEVSDRFLDEYELDPPPKLDAQLGFFDDKRDRSKGYDDIEEQQAKERRHGIDL